MLIYLVCAIGFIPHAKEVVPYWRDPRIHNLGNVGMRGMLHALAAPMATRIIDILAYEGRDVRAELLQDIGEHETVVDLCCGTGLSTHPTG